MQYLKVIWKHDDAEYPAQIYSELDDERYEVRKVDIFNDGRRGFASERETFGGADLGERPILPIAEIQSDPEFDAVELTADEFERVWNETVDASRTS